ncbi:3-dehydroquinate synthase [Lacrimispora saccharolytica]|uniref:3-dehydroquinate synthase n=1 Tax=Lacrimispora saccharolytica (strain ATCC 35040 / DSM 2544 / NRCC 2533 / WM1) TaxID=610130 RepID=D9R163_LACSW|nr:3-dehydroquinate synthase [Lacrimispora saccharolytica]ADL04610.1 3-dehydroquinate synthase [[Clostridium] saccharolyticum WM1]QRV21149.1 3-dehydroquinate synthase [Lacrimispora saccharolytica]
MGNRIPVHMNGTLIYEIVMEAGFGRLKEELKKLNLEERKICIVTDSNVASLYLEEVESIVSSCCRKAEHFIFPAGEENKNLDTVKNLYEALILKQFDRQDYLLALGGGVVGDLCGYGAATYLRGISFIQVPTTLLSQVDSSIGGKTGVDFDSYKNMVGAFHMPKLVYTNIASLKTLSEEQFSSGMGEIIKHGLIKDEPYYRWLMEHATEIQNRDFTVLSQLVLVSNQIKREVVEKDPTEQGERALLNLGHTLGHAIEKLSDFRLMHGHCVGLGCIAAMAISINRGMIQPEELSRLLSVMEAFGMPVTVSGLSPENIVLTTRSDKKMDSGTVRFILLEQIGKACVNKTVTEAEMTEGLRHILA